VASKRSKPSYHRLLYGKTLLIVYKVGGGGEGSFVCSKDRTKSEPEYLEISGTCFKGVQLKDVAGEAS
jgi:hypothetical protein